MSGTNTPPSGFLPFALPDLGEEEIAEVVDTLRSGWITTGPKVRRFEEEFAAYFGGGLHAMTVNSATAGLHLAMDAIGIGAGDEVIVPTHTFTATAEVVRYMGADVVFTDVDPRTYCIDPAAVASAITPSTRAIIPVHYAGLACDMRAILATAQRHGLHVVEDASHAFPTRYWGDLVGTLASTFAVFSFYATKTLATAEGGMVLTRDAALAKRVKTMRLHGIDRDAFDRYTTKKPAWYYEVVAPGFKYNMTDIAAAIGLHQLRKADRFQARRAALANRYLDAFRDLPLQLPASAPAGSAHAWHLFVVQLLPDAGVTRDQAIDALFRLGIGCSVHYVPLHQQPYWRDRYGLQPAMFPVSQQLYERGFSLPLYTRMSDADQLRVIDAVCSLFR